jgi:NAD(P)-dependent dehydrogenase (short-subunit alcohol dehydrogenase family)
MRSKVAIRLFGAKCPFVKSAEENMSKLLDGKVVVVTGAGGGRGAKGVGECIAIEAASLGARVVVNDVGRLDSGRSTAEITVEAIKAAGGSAAVSLDSVASWSGAEKLIQCAIDNFGRIDGVVNNAGVLRDKIFFKMTEEEWDISISVNLKGCFNVARMAAPHLKDQNSGSIIHMTSSSGLIGNFGQANYCAAKLGLVGLSKAIALDMQRFKVRSNCIAPFAMTPMVIGGVPNQTDEDKARWRVIERMKPENIAPFACAMLSDAASDITGQIFGVRANEIYLFNQPRPIRTAHSAEPGWTAETVVKRVFPMFRPSFFPLDRSMDVFSWDPV